MKNYLIFVLFPHGMFCTSQTKIKTDTQSENTNVFQTTHHYSDKDIHVFYFLLHVYRCSLHA